jgi:uridine kinase
MRLPITPATTLWRELREEVRHNYPRGRVILAVDGADAVPTRAFADGFAAVLAEDGAAVVRASLDDFRLPRAARTPEEPYDVPAFRRVLAEPFRDGAQTSGTTGFQLAAFDVARDAPVEAQWTTAPLDAVLVVDGDGLQRPGLAGLWNWTVWLDEGAPPRLGEARGASAIVELTRPDEPRRVYRDYC